MNDIRRVLRLAAWRMYLVGLIRSGVLMLAAILTVAILLRLAQPFLHRFLDAQINWMTVAWSSLAALVLGALALTISTRPNRLAVARRVDEGADLRETLSTALCIAGQDDAWSRVAVESAGARARSVKVREAVPIAPPAFWPVPLALALSLFVLWLVVPSQWPSKAALARAGRDPLAAEAAMLQVKAAESKIDEIKAKLGLTDGDADATPEPESPEKPEARDPQTAQRTALKKLTTLKDRLEELKMGDKGQELAVVQQTLRQLRTPGKGPVTELSQKLARGDFQGAAEELQKLAQQAASSTMPEADRQRAAEQLEKLSEQLAELAKNQEALARKLAEAGLDKALAGNPEALKAALEKAANLSQEQKDAIAKAAAAQAQSAQACSSMSASMAQMAQAMSQEGLSKEGMQGMEGMQAQLSELEQMSQDMDLADAALSETKSQLQALASFMQCDNPGMGECSGGGESLMAGTNPWSAGDTGEEGNGSGGPGQGRGGEVGTKEAEVSWEKKKFKTAVQAGPVIGTRLVEGEQIRGESHAAFAAAVAEADQQATEALESNQIPLEYRDSVKHYFGRLKAKAGPSSAPAPAPAPTPSPVEDDTK